MLELEPDAVLTLEPGIVLHSIPDQNWFYAFSVHTGDQYRLNRTSYWVLEQIGEGVKWDRLMTNYLDFFDVIAIQGKKDLRQLVSQLSKQKIIRRKESEKDKN